MGQAARLEHLSTVLEKLDDELTCIIAFFAEYESRREQRPNASSSFACDPVEGVYSLYSPPHITSGSASQASPYSRAGWACAA
jgi:hypothetical protein